MLCLADDAGLARVAIGATSVPRAQRRRWLEDLAARLEGVSPTEPSPGARYTRAWRTREANGQVLLKVVVDEAALAALLVDRGLLDPLRADDRDALAVSAARLLAQLCEVSPHDEKLLLARAARTTVGDLRVGDLAEAIHDALQSQKHEILKHVHRLFSQVKASAEYDNERRRAFDKKLHRRLIELESDVRQLRRKGAP